MAPILFCRRCGHFYQVSRVVPDVCPHCEQLACWTTDAPLKPYVLSENDRRFLRSIKIAPEQESGS